MKTTRSNLRVGLLAIVWIMGSTGARSETPEPALPQRQFDTPEQAVQSLLAATRAKDKTALRQIFGPSVQQMLTGDEARDAANFDSFSAAITQNCTPVPEGSQKQILEIGPHQYPFPIPLVNQDGKWFFDTEAGKQEIICRHIGKDELHAIGFCRAYVEAQRQFARQHAGPAGFQSYASRLKPIPAGGNPAEPLPPLITLLDNPGGQTGARSADQGFNFYGYQFKILTRQGSAAATGKLNYLDHGQMVRGFGLVAYPSHWGKSGIMTFIVNQEGKVYQRNLGEKTASLAPSLVEFNPTKQWTLVTEPGVLD